MTARRTDETTQVKTGGLGGESTDKQSLLEYIRDQGRVSLEKLAKRSGLTERRVRRLVMDLDERGLIEVEPTPRAVWVTPVEPETRTSDRSEHGRDGVATDGGPIQRLVHAITSSSETIDVTEDELYECLGNARRRRILRYLAAFYDEHNRVWVEAHTVADALADRMREGTREMPAREDDGRHRHYVSVSQVHGPYLDDLGLVEYYDRVNKLRATSDGVAVASLMTEIADLCADEPQEVEQA